MELKDYNLYSLFIKACELKNYTRVAEEVGLSSHHIVSDKMKMLEQKIGVKLFNRAFRSMEPTSDALVLYDKVKKSLTEIDLAASNAREFDKDSEAIIRMIVPATILGIVMGRYFTEFKRKYPKVEIETYNRAETENFDLLAQSKVDFIIDRDYVCKKYELNTMNLVNFQCVLVVSKKFAQDNKIGAEITLQELEKLPIIGYKEDIQDLVATQGLKALSFLKTAKLKPVYSLVKSDTGVGVYYEKFVELKDKENDLIILKPKGFSLPSRMLSLGYKGEMTKAAQTFADGLVDYLLKFSI